MSGRLHRSPRPGRASHPSRKSPGFSALLRRLPAHGRTNARARTFAHVHTQQKEAVRTACRGLVAALRKPLPSGPRRAARSLLTYQSAPGAAGRCTDPGGQQPTGPALLRRTCGRSGRSRRLRGGGRGPTTCCGSTPLLRPPPSRAPAKSHPCGCRIGPGLQKPREHEGSLLPGFPKK